MELKYKKHIIWDWNGTLLDDVNYSIERINLVLEKRQLPLLRYQHYRKIFTFPVIDYYKKIGLLDIGESFEDVGKEFIDYYNKDRFDCLLFSDVLSGLIYLMNIGINNSILSAYSSDSLNEFLHKLEIKHFFKFIYGLDHIYASSKLEQGKELINKIDCEKREILLIGDTVHDHDVAKELGIDCVLISRGHQCEEVLSNCTNMVYSSIESVIKLLRKDESH